VNQVFGAQGIFCLAEADRSRQIRHVGGRPQVTRHCADAQGIENGGDSRSGDLRVVSDDRRDMGPFDSRPRYKVPLQVIGVQFDETGN
jgi:hypothetical protein